MVLSKSSKQGQSTQSNAFNLSDLGGEVKSPIIFPDGHFGLESAIWNNAQRIADTLPIDVRVSGDINEQIVIDITEKAKGAELQQKCWTEYSSAVSRYLKAFQKIKEKQAEVAENVAQKRLDIANLEKDLGTTLASLESQYRQVVGSYRGAIATKQDEMTINLAKISEQYTQTKAKREEAQQLEVKKDESAFTKQSTSLIDRFRKAREARYAGASVGITHRVKEAS